MLIKKFLSELKLSPSNVHFVYGTQDPWTGGAVPDENLGPNMKKLIIKDGTHDDNIYTWTPSERNQLLQWLDGLGFEIPK